MAKESDPVLKELVAIRKLLVLGLLKSGMTQNQVAAALDIDRSSVSRMFGKGALTGLTKQTAE
jgi:DNA-binding transcriptional regulator LsrR (DeoR family)